MDAGQDVILPAELREATEPGARLVDLPGQGAERLVGPVAELDPPDAVVRGRGEDGLGVRAVDVGHGGADHGDRHAGLVGDPLRLGQPALGVLGLDVPPRAQGQVQPVEARLPCGLHGLGDG